MGSELLLTLLERHKFYNAKGKRDNIWENVRVKMNDIVGAIFFKKEIFIILSYYYFFFYIAKSIFDLVVTGLFFNDSFLI